MKEKIRSAGLLCLTILVLLLTSTRLPADTGTCGGAMTALPFTDVAGNVFFCQIAEAYFSGLTNGTTPTTYSPSNGVSREQMAAFVTRTQDSALRRGSRNAALGRWGLPTRVVVAESVANGARQVKSDGADLWVASEAGGTVAACGRKPQPVRTPAAAEHQRVTAVFKPHTLNPSRMITPAPRKPMPETT